MMLIRHFYNEKFKQGAGLCHVNLNKYMDLLAFSSMTKKKLPKKLERRKN